MSAASAALILAAVHAALIRCCESSTAYYFFAMWSVNVYAVLRIQCSTASTFNMCPCACWDIDSNNSNNTGSHIISKKGSRGGGVWETINC